MAKVRITVDKRKDIFLYKTGIENLVISEFVPAAPGDYVKVYLFGLMYAQFSQEADNLELAKALGLREDEVEEAWIYWESRGLVKILREQDEKGEKNCNIIFHSQIDELYGRAGNEPEDPAGVSKDAAGKEEPEVPLHVSIDDAEFDDIMKSRLVDKRLRDLYSKYQSVTGRTISRQETSKIEEAIRVYDIEPDIFDFAIDYCADIGKYNIDYISKVAFRWTEENCRTIDDVRKLLEKHSRRNSWYRQVFKALGFNRLPAPADREIMDRWFDEMELSIEEVLDACSAAAGIRDPNLRYVNKILENRRLEKGGINTKTETDVKADGSPVSRRVLNDYYKHIRDEEERSCLERRNAVTSRLKEMKDLFEAEREVGMKLISLKPGSNDSGIRQKLRAERIGIEERKRQLLEENGFPGDYLDRKYRCSKCRDTGYTDEGMVCSCCRQRAEEAFRWHTGKEKA